MPKLFKLSLAHLSLFLGLLISFFYFTPSCLADGIKLSPSIIEQNVAPGQVMTQAINVSNESGNSMKIYVYLKDFTADGEDGSPKLLAPGTTEGSFMSSWIEVNDANGVDIPAGTSHVFNFKISVPKETGPGGYYGALVFGTKAEDVRTNAAEKGAASGISQQAGSLLLLRVPGEANETAMVRDFTPDKGLYNTPFNVKFLTRIENQGNVHIKPRGLIQITNLFDKEVAMVKVNDPGANVLPKSVRKFNSEWADTMGFGRYKATLAMTYGVPVENGGNGQQTLTSISYFWIVPWKIAGWVIFALLLMIGAVYGLITYYKRKAMHGAMMHANMNGMPYQQQQTVPSSDAHLKLMMLIVVLLVIVLLGTVIFLLFA